MNKICIFTGTRAEYGLLKPLIDEIVTEVYFDLQMIVSGMHLSPEFGLTVKQIEADGIKIDEKVECLLSSDSSVGVSKSVGLGVIGYTESLNRLNPDLVVILGDRFEALAMAVSCMIHRIPIAHLHGGELTEGLVDESIRHSVTKMSYFHFTSTEEYRNRVIQLGENPKRVFNVGAIGIDNIRNLELLTKDELEKQIKFKFNKRNLLITFHPVTLENKTSEKQFSELLFAIDELIETNLFFTKPNSDTEGRIISSMIDRYVAENKGKSAAFTSMGQLNYLSAMQFIDAVVGNSSSGIIEAPSFGTGTINIGDRQKGRVVSGSVINCKPNKEDILCAMNDLYSENFQSKLKKCKNPYGNGGVSKKIIKILKENISNICLKKEFYDLK